MVGDKTTKNNSVELEASLAPGEAEVGAVAKADHLLETKFKQKNMDDVPIIAEPIDYQTQNQGGRPFQDQFLKISEK